MRFTSEERATQSQGVSLARGTVVGGRYRVETKLGEGGMGVVFEATRVEDGARVALKVLRTGDETPEARQRLLREASAAISVRHPHVVRVHEVFQLDDGAPVLAMELLRGEPLSKKLGREGKLPLAEVAAIMSPVVSAVRAAHERGVIHRDLKPDNIFLCEQESGPARVKVLDFGIAKVVQPLEQHSHEAVLTSTGQVLGTPQYMAPEQVYGERDLDHRADVWTLGIVLYECLTGRVPTRGGNVGQVLKLVTQGGIEPIAERAPDLPADVVRLVGRMLERDRDVRLSELGEALAVLERYIELAPDSFVVTSSHRTQRVVAGSGAALGAGVPETERQPVANEPTLRAAEMAELVPSRPEHTTKPGRSTVLVGALALSMIVAGTAMVLTRSTSSASRAAASSSAEARASSAPGAGSAIAPVRRRQAVAVLGFKNLSGKPDVAWLSTAASELLGAELATGGQLRLVPGESTTRTRGELGLPEADAFAADTLQKIHERLGADYVIVGSYLATGASQQGELRLMLRLQDAASGDTVQALHEVGPQAKLGELVSRMASRVREQLGAGGMTSDEVARAHASLPADPMAARLYSEGIEALRKYELPDARDKLSRAAEREPAHPGIHAALAETWRRLANAKQAREEAKRAQELAGGLPKQEQLLVEARYWLAWEKWGEAANTYRKLYDAAPDDLEAGLGLAEALSQSGRAVQAIEVLDQLRRLPPPVGEAAEIDLADASAAVLASDFRRAEERAHVAANKAEKTQSQRLLGRALMWRSWARRNLGDPAHALEDVTRAKRILDASGDADWAMQALQVSAALFIDLGRLADARAQYEEYLVTVDQGGFEVERVATYSNLAGVWWRIGDIGRGKDYEEKSLSLAEAGGFRPEFAYARTQLGYLLLSGGNPAGARAQLDRAIPELSTVGDRRVEAWALLARGKVAFEEGDLDSARRDEQASLAIRRELDLKGFVAESENELAALAFAMGNADEAERLARSSADGFAKLGAPIDEATARATLAEVLLAKGDTSGAGQSARRAAELAKDSEALEARIRVLSVALAVARALGREDEARDDGRRLEAGAQSARAGGCKAGELAARFAIARDQLAAGEHSARAQMQLVEREATAIGFQRIAREAQAALSR